MRNALLPTAILCTLFLSSCTTSRSDITLHASAQNRPVIVDFPRGWITREDQGDYHIILIDDPITREGKSQPPGPIEPVSMRNPKQVMHIHVFWRPMRGTKADNPSATNASIDWYFIGDEGANSTDLIHYQGAGFVTVYSNANEASIRIKSAAMSPHVVRGAMADKLGAFSFSGSAEAAWSSARVRDAIADLNALDNPPAVRASAP